VHNIPLLAINIILEKLVNYAIHPKDDSYKSYLAVTYLCFAESAFFSAGNSNTLSTIDVSPAFIGLDSYQPFFAGLFMIINMYSLYVYWILMLFIRLKECKRVVSAISKLSSVINLLLVTRFLTVVFDMCVTIALENHLFIWSVLCPKFLYEAIITLINEIIIICVLFNHIID
jgi:ethanolaminephosphotransferase